MASSLTPGTPANAQVNTAVVVLTARMRRGANWFYWIAGFSLINALLIGFGGNLRFIIGLGITDLVEGIAKGPAQGSTTATVAALVVDVFIAGLFVLFGKMANHRAGWAFLVGMILYALDAGLLLLASDWLSAAFHAYVLFALYQGFAAYQQLGKLQAAAAMASAGTTGPKPIG